MLLPSVFQSTFPRGERLSRPILDCCQVTFQSTFPRGERRGPPVIFISSRNFNPRSLVGNDVLRFRINEPLLLFQSTFPRGERRHIHQCKFHHDHFNPRSLVGNDPTSPFLVVTFLDFNPRSLVGNDILVCAFLHHVFISIHVPSWGTTMTTAAFRCCCIFQSTFPRGERRNDNCCISLLLYISIHVPSWGTTANFHKYSLFFYAINIIFLLFIIPSLFSLVLFMLLF